MAIEDNGKGEHYQQAPFDVLQVQGYVAENFRKHIAPSLPSIGEKTWCIGTALKHLLRLGLKGDVQLDLYKAENYIHRARVGEWLKEENK